MPKGKSFFEHAHHHQQPLLTWDEGIFLPSELDYTIIPHAGEAGLEIISHYECFYRNDAISMWTFLRQYGTF